MTGRLPQLVLACSGFCRECGTPALGGIESYVAMLAKVMRERFLVRVVQPAEKPFSRVVDGLKVEGLPGGGRQFASLVDRQLGGRDVLIWSTEQLPGRPRWARTVCIQHGVYWDLPAAAYSGSLLARHWPEAFKALDNYRNLLRIRRFPFVVCVDHNYVNWLRALGGDRPGAVKVIPNCADRAFFRIEPLLESNEVSILFPRRFLAIRGTRLFAPVALRILEQYQNVRITFAGEGPDLELLTAIALQEPRASISRVAREDMPQVMAQHDVVVVPSLGSEGTSLAVLEAMAGGRVVIATNVGGITNAVIDGFNGLLCEPAEDDLYRTIVRVVKDAPYRVALGSRAREVATLSFGMERWSERWHATLDELYRVVG